MNASARQYTLYRLPFLKRDEPWNWLIEADPFDTFVAAEAEKRRLQTGPRNLDSFKIVDEPKGYGA